MKKTIMKMQPTLSVRCLARISMDKKSRRRMRIKTMITKNGNQAGQGLFFGKVKKGQGWTDTSPPKQRQNSTNTA